jgi:hypothetical protein
MSGIVQGLAGLISWGVLGFTIVAVVSLVCMARPPAIPAFARPRGAGTVTGQLRQDPNARFIFDRRRFLFQKRSFSSALGVHRFASLIKTSPKRMSSGGTIPWQSHPRDRAPGGDSGMSSIGTRPVTPLRMCSR